jgi:hypothetical protein
MEPTSIPPAAAPVVESTEPIVAAVHGPQTENPTFYAGPSQKRDWPSFVASTVQVLHDVKKWYEEWCKNVPLHKRERKIKSKNDAAGHDIYEYGKSCYAKLVNSEYPEVSEEHRNQLIECLSFIYFYNQIVDIAVETTIKTDKITQVTKIGRSDRAESDVEMGDEKEAVKKAI